MEVYYRRLEVLTRMNASVSTLTHDLAILKEDASHCLNDDPAFLPVRPLLLIELACGDVRTSLQKVEKEIQRHHQALTLWSPIHNLPTEILISSLNGAWPPSNEYPNIVWQGQSQSK